MTAVSTIDILPCPFCGNAPSYNSSPDAWIYIGCTDEECCGPFVSEADTGIAANFSVVKHRWNMRIRRLTKAQSQTEERSDG